jgi:hypothetical protein
VSGLLKKISEFTCGFMVFFIVSSASFFGFYGKWHFRDAHPDLDAQAFSGSLDKVLDGTAPRPFVYRQLLPMIANGIDRATPETLKDRLFSITTPGGHLLRERLFVATLAQDRHYFFRYWIIYLLTFFFSFASTCAMYFLVGNMGYDPLVATFSSAFFILLMPFFMSVGGYYYDYVELTFLVLAVLIALRFYWGWLIPLALLAAWNKESFLLFVPCLYPLLRMKYSRQMALVATAANGVACGLVVFLLRIRYAQNPGGTVQFHMFAQILYFLNPLRMLSPLDSTYGIIFLPSLNPISLVLIFWIVWNGWKSLPISIRRFSIVASIINIPLFLLFCSPGELRNLSFLYVPFLLLIAGLAHELQSKNASFSGKTPEIA